MSSISEVRYRCFSYRKIAIIIIGVCDETNTSFASIPWQGNFQSTTTKKSESLGVEAALKILSSMEMDWTAGVEGTKVGGLGLGKLTPLLCKFFLAELRMAWTFIGRFLEQQKTKTMEPENFTSHTGSGERYLRRAVAGVAAATTAASGVSGVVVEALGVAGDPGGAGDSTTANMKSFSDGCYFHRTR